MIRTESAKIGYLSDAEGLLRGVTEELSLPSRSFISSKDHVVSKAATIAREYNVRPDIFVDSVRVIELLALADSLNSGFVHHRLEPSLLSEIVGAKLSHVSHQKTENVDAPAVIDSPSPISDRVINLWRRDYYDENLSHTAKKEYERKGAFTLLEETRSRLLLPRELDFNVEVFDVDQYDFMVQFKNIGFIQYAGSTPIIFLPRNSSNNTKIHEWIHTQLRCLKSGMHYSLYHGLNEAVTESHTPDPQTYEDQRVLYSTVASKLGTDFRSLILTTSYGDPGAKVRLCRVLATHYTLPGLLALMRMTPIADDEHAQFYSDAQKLVFQDVADVEAILRYTGVEAQDSFGSNSQAAD